MTIKQYAQSQNISYEAARKQIVSFGEELTGHIVRKGRTQYLDEWAVEFLTKRRRENPTILFNQDREETIDRLKSDIDALRVQLLAAQKELLDEKERVIYLQDEAKKTIEERAKYKALLESNEAKEKELKETGAQIGGLSRQLEEKDGQIRTIQAETDELRKTIGALQRERDEAKTEAQSFRRSIFGFYRKR
jgi:chromosome segregation ATPase